MALGQLTRAASLEKMPSPLENVMPPDAKPSETQEVKLPSDDFQATKFQCPQMQHVPEADAQSAVQNIEYAIKNSTSAKQTMDTVFGIVKSLVGFVK